MSKLKTIAPADARAAIDDLIAVVDRLRSRIENKHPQWHVQGVVFLEGLNGKLRQVAFALSTLDLLAATPSDPNAASTDASALGYEDRVYFYADAFWAFLCACLDITAQLITIHHALGIANTQVGMNETLHQTLVDNNKTSFAASVSAALRSKEVRDTKAYRNCSLHRRHVCLTFNVNTTTPSRGYTALTNAPASQTIVVKLICDNPLEDPPKFDLKQTLVGLCATRTVEVIMHVKPILNMIKKEIR